jgi:dGTPase
VSEGRQEDWRTAYQHDRDRIVHSRAFRRLKHKTQVFIPYKNDHQRTRLTHTIEVMQLARTIARSLGLNEDLVEAISLGHDVGHTPFGHVGERTLIEIMNGRTLENVIPADLLENNVGFKHNVQSLRVIDVLEIRYDHPGLNLTDQTREGILKHTAWQKWRNYPGLEPEGLFMERDFAHFEGQVLAIADEIAQQTHDLEDGMRNRLVTTREVMELEIVQYIAQKNPAINDKKLSNFHRQNSIIRSLIHILVVNVIAESAKRIEQWRSEHGISTHDDFEKQQDAIEECVQFTPDITPMFQELSTFVLKKVIRSEMVQRNDEAGRYLIRELFSLFYDDPTSLAWYILEEYRRQKKIKHLHEIGKYGTKEEVEQEINRNYRSDPDFLRLICDYIAGMSNTYAIREYEKWVMPFHG